MLSAHLGVDTFLNGVSNYLKAHAYGQCYVCILSFNSDKSVPGNATTNDLWEALSEASGHDVTSFMVSPFEIISSSMTLISKGHMDP